MTAIAITGIGYVGPGANSWREAAARDEPPAFAPWPDDMAAPHGGARVGTVADFPRFLSDRDAAKVDRLAAIATTAAGLALEDAGIGAPLAEDAAGFFATCRGEMGSGQRYAAPIFQGKPRMINPALFPRMCRNLFCGQIAIRFGLKGHSSMMSGGPLSGLHALERGAAAIRTGRSRLALVGAAETLSKFSLDFARLLYGDHIGTPAFFAPEGGGLVPSEGGCMLVLERRDDALARGARIYAFLDGMSSGRARDAAALRAGMARLLERAGIGTARIGLVSSGQSGAGQSHDRAEQALWRQLGAQCPPLAAARSLTGEAESMSAVAQVALAAQALADGETPPVWNLARGSSLPAAAARRKLAERHVLVSALDAGGNYAFLALSRETGP